MLLQPPPAFFGSPPFVISLEYTISVAKGPSVSHGSERQAPPFRPFIFAKGKKKKSVHVAEGQRFLQCAHSAQIYCYYLVPICSSPVPIQSSDSLLPPFQLYRLKLMTRLRIFVMCPILPSL